MLRPETRVPAGWGSRSDPSGRWMAAVAHELKNPIQGLENALYLLQQTPLDKPARVYMDFAKKELEHMKLLVAGLLDRYRNNGNPGHVSMCEVLDAALAFYAHKIEFKKVEVATRYTTPGLIHAPAGDMRQVFRNLIVNALEALPSEGGRLVLRISHSRDGNHPGAGRVRASP